MNRLWLLLCVSVVCTGCFGESDKTAQGPSGKKEDMSIPEPPPGLDGDFEEKPSVDPTSPGEGPDSFDPEPLVEPDPTPDPSEVD